MASEIITASTYVAPLARSHQRAVDAENKWYNKAAISFAPITVQIASSLLPASMPRELEPRRSQPHAAANHIDHRRDEDCENNVATTGFHNYHASHGNAYRQLDPRA